MDHATGVETSAIEDVRQACADILWTPLGSRVARRDYGSRLPDLIDAPANAANRTLLYAAVATALRRWEPRISVQRVQLVTADALQGRFVVELDVQIVDAGAAQSFRLTIDQGNALA